MVKTYTEETMKQPLKWKKCDCPFCPYLHFQEKEEQNDVDVLKNLVTRQHERFGELSKEIRDLRDELVDGGNILSTQVSALKEEIEEQIDDIREELNRVYDWVDKLRNESRDGYLS